MVSGFLKPWGPFFIDFEDTKKWNLRVDPKHCFLATIVMESQGLPYEMPNEVCEGNFGGAFLGTVTAVPRGTAVTGHLG